MSLDQFKNLINTWSGSSCHCFAYKASAWFPSLSMLDIPEFCTCITKRLQTKTCSSYLW
jgi:hypothetical protein